MIRLVTKETFRIQDYTDIVQLCSENRDLENFSDVDWGNNPASLLYKIFFTDTFSEKNGAYLLLYDKDKVVHMSGFNKSDFDDNVYICGVRTLTRHSKQHQLLMSRYMLPKQEEEVKRRGGKMMMFCFENGGSLYKVIQQGKFNLFLKNKAYKFYEGLTPYHLPVYVNYTKHYVLYKLLDPSFKFDWEKIHYDNIHDQGC